MRIGLIRHFKVDYRNFRPLYYPEEYNAAIKGYDEADIILGESNLDGIEWQICYSSTYNRAAKTARHIYKDEIVKTDLLREVDLKAFTVRKIKLPSFVWHLGARISWALNGKSQPETRLSTNYRIEKFYSRIIDSKKENVLIVSHGFFMKCFASFLISKGFEGKIDPIPHNGRLYIFTKKGE